MQNLFFSKKLTILPVFSLWALLFGSNVLSGAALQSEDAPPSQGQPYQEDKHILNWDTCNAKQKKTKNIEEELLTEGLNFPIEYNSDEEVSDKAEETPKQKRNEVIKHYPIELDSQSDSSEASENILALQSAPLHDKKVRMHFKKQEKRKKVEPLNLPIAYYSQEESGDESEKKEDKYGKKNLDLQPAPLHDKKVRMRFKKHEKRKKMEPLNFPIAYQSQEESSESADEQIQKKKIKSRKKNFPIAFSRDEKKKNRDVMPKKEPQKKSKPQRVVKNASLSLSPRGNRGSFLDVLPFGYLRDKELVIWREGVNLEEESMAHLDEVPTSQKEDSFDTIKGYIDKMMEQIKKYREEEKKLENTIVKTENEIKVLKEQMKKLREKINRKQKAYKNIQEPLVQTKEEMIQFNEGKSKSNYAINKRMKEYNTYQEYVVIFQNDLKENKNHLAKVKKIMNHTIAILKRYLDKKIPD